MQIYSVIIGRDFRKDPNTKSSVKQLDKTVSEKDWHNFAIQYESVISMEVGWSHSVIFLLQYSLKAVATIFSTGTRTISAICA